MASAILSREQKKRANKSWSRILFGRMGKFVAALFSHSRLPRPHTHTAFAHKTNEGAQQQQKQQQLVL